MKDLKPISKKRLCQLLEKLCKVDGKLYELVKPLNRYGETQIGAWFLDCQNVLDLIYLEFRGERESKTYAKFKTTSWDKSKDLPIAWYTTQYNQDGDGSTKGPKGYTGFIPDSINDVIVSSKLSSEKKFFLLNRMFKDLARLEKEFTPLDASLDPNKSVKVSL